MKNKINIIYPLFFLLFFAFPLIAFAQTFQSNCVITKVGNPKTAPVLPPECSTGEVPSADRQALLNQIKGFVDSRKIIFSHSNDRTGMTNGTGQVKRKDGAMVAIDTQVLRVYVYLVNKGFTFTVSSMIGTHKQYSSSGNQSRHWTGHGVDVSVINGLSLTNPAAKPATISFMKSLNSLVGGDLTPRQLLCNGNGRVDPEVDALSMNGGKIAPGFTLKYINAKDHQNHVHIGY